MGGKNINIALVFGGNPRDGGGYQEQLSVLNRLCKVGNHRFVVFVFSNEHGKFLQQNNIEYAVVNECYLGKCLRYLARYEFFFPLFSWLKWKSAFEKKLDSWGIDLVYFLSPSTLALDIVAHNYIMTVWDLSHRDFPEFPEVNYFREFEKREFFYTRVLKKAVAVIADSQSGRKNLIERYALDPDRVFSVSFEPSQSVLKADTSEDIDVRLKYEIVTDYIYYPAQFWSHKNHIYILDALRILVDKGIKITVVFSGTDKGNLEYVLNYARQSGLDRFVRYIGFVSSDELLALYRHSTALVMPTWFGPTNIPPLEAFWVGTPVIYSDLEGLREQVDGAALLCDLNNPASLADHIETLLSNSGVREKLVYMGRKRLEELQASTVTDTLQKIVDTYSVRLKCWEALYGK